MPDRMVYTNVPDMELPNNRIETSKYNLLTFFPKNLFEQFRKLANIYFLVIGGLQMINEISNSDGQPVIWLPLLVIVVITMIKDLVEDFKRHQSDKEENTRTSRVLRHGAFVNIIWENIRVGDIVKVSIFYFTN
jgi:phospholipid-transporting ATPase